MSFSSNTGITANGIANTIISSLDTSLFNISNAPAGNDLINAISKGINDTANTLSASFNSIIASSANTLSDLKVDKWGRVTVHLPNTSITHVTTPIGLVLTSNTIIGTDGTLVGYLYADWDGTNNSNTDIGFTSYPLQVRKTSDLTPPSTPYVKTNHYEQIADCGVEYGVRVGVQDVYSNYTTYCDEVTITIAANTIPPETPFDIEVISFVGFIRLKWSHGGEGDLSHFDVWRSSTNNLATATKVGSAVKDFLGTWAIFDDDPGDYNTYYYWIYAVNRSQLYSGVSAVVSGVKIKITGTNIGPDSITSNNILGLTITGDKIHGGTIDASKLFVVSLSAITANVGLLNAGIMQSLNWGSANGSMINLNDGTMFMGGYTSPHLSYDGTHLDLNVSRFRISDANTNVFEVAGGNVYVNGNFMVDGTVQTGGVSDNAITGMVTAYSSTTLMPSITWFTYVSGNYQYFHTFADSQTYTNPWDDATFYSNLRERTRNDRK